MIVHSHIDLTNNTEKEEIMKTQLKHLKAIAAAIVLIAMSYGNSNAQSAAINFLPATIQAEVGETFFVEVQFDTDNIPVSVFDLHMLFDANYLEVLSIEKLQDDLFNYHVAPGFDNTNGKMDMAAFQIGKTIPESFSVIKIELLALAPTELTEVTQNTTGFPKTLLAYGGQDVLGSTGSLEVQINGEATLIDDPKGTDEFGLNIWPNPATDIANISFTVKDSKEVSLKIFDATGKLVKAVFSGSVTPGAEKKLEVDINDFASGNYTCQLTSGDKVQVQKLNVVK